MFNKHSSALEIEQSMERKIVSATFDKQTEGLNKIASAIDHLNAAAELFDDAGMYKVAEYTTSLLEVIAKKKKPKKTDKKTSKKTDKKSKKDPATDGLTPEKEVENLKEKGWVFNADDNASNDCDCNFVNDVKTNKKHGHDCVCPHCLGVKHSHDDDCMCSMCMDANDAMDDNFHFDTNWDMNEVKEPHQLQKMDKRLFSEVEKHRPMHERVVHDFEGLHDFEDENTLGELPHADKARQEDFWNIDLFDRPDGFRGEPAMKPRRRF